MLSEPLQAETDDRTLENALSNLAACRTLLRNASPAALDQCASALADTARLLCEWRDQRRREPGDPAAAEKARELRTAVRHAERLLEGAADYHARWNRILSAMSSGYTPSGASPLPARPARVLVRG